MRALLSKYYLLALVLVNFYIFQSCENVDQEIVGSGISIQEQRIYTDFNEVEVNGNYTITFTSDSNYSVLISGDDNVLPFINSYVDGNTLKIKNDENVQIRNASIEIDISLPDLTHFVSQGNVIVSSQNVLSGNVLSVEANGKSGFDLQLQVNYLTVNLQGTSTAKLVGVAKECLLDLSGKIDLTSNLMEVDELDINKDGNVLATIFASDKLTINSKGTGDVICYGNPVYIEQDMKGNGKLVLQ